MPGNDLVARLGVDSSAWTSGFQKARSTASSFGSSLGTLLNPGIAAVAAGLAGMWGAGSSVSAFKESLDAQRKLSAVIEATGGAAGLTTGDIAGFAAEMQQLTNFEDDATTAAAAMLVPFTNIRGQTFTDTIESAMDLSTVMGGELGDNVKLLGKALNDPTEGLGKLRKAGVMFTEQQEKQIAALQKSGDLLGAQNMILDGVQSKFGGAAMAVADPWKQLSNTLGDVAENIGSVLLPTINVVSDTVRQWLGPIVDNGDAFKQFGIEAAVALSTVGGWVVTAAESLTSTLGPSIMFVTDTIGTMLEMVGLGGGTFQDFITEVGATFENLGGYIDLAINEFLLFFVQVGENAAHYFTEVIPAYVNWFANNAQNILVTLGSNTLTIFENIGTNIKSAWSSILAYLQGAPLVFDWKPLTDGFINTVDKLPSIPDRVIGDLEKGLKDSVAASSESLSRSLQESRDKFNESMNGQRDRLNKQLDTGSKVPSGMIVPGAEASHSTEKKSESKAALIGTQEAANIFTRQPKDSPLAEQKKTNELLKAQNDYLMRGSKAPEISSPGRMAIANFGGRS